MKRRAVISLVVLVCTPIVAQATITVTAPTVQITGVTQILDILISADAGETANAMDFTMTIHGAFAPVITAVDLLAPGSLFDPATSPDGPDVGTAPDEKRKRDITDFLFVAGLGRRKCDLASSFG